MSEVSREQDYVTALHERVDVLREQASAGLALTLRQAVGTAQSRLERDAVVSRLAGQLARLEAADGGLCFGRLDLLTGESRYIGRIGLREESREGEPLLVDWRAPAARAFYVATAGAPHGVRRRRYIHLRGRQVTGLNDEVLDRAELAVAPGLTGEAALLAALQATRSGRMRDIVGTLQAEQDAIIRAAHSGILVVQGGPGTGKTAVALHRAAYLLYTHRHLADRGVLIVGPSTTFLGYISQVLPGLGETNVLLRIISELFPGVAVNRAEGQLAEEVKGRAAMADVIAAAIRGRQATHSSEVEFGGERLWLDRQVVRVATRRARATRLPHNRARAHFQRQIVAVLAEQYAERARQLVERLEAEVADILAEAREAIEADLASITEILGAPGDDQQPQIADLRRELWADPEVQARLDAAELSARHEARGHRSVAERAAEDRTWAFGHVIVDEAQELSQMAWRLLARRCPARSMTIVGDVAQVGSSAGTTSWEDGLDPVAGDRWRLARLTVNYRTPAEIMGVTTSLLAEIDPGQQPPQSVRQTGVRPWRMSITRDALPAALAKITAAEAATEGSLAVIVPDARVAELGDALCRAVPAVSYGENPDLTSPVVLLGAKQAKGLEFDSVLIADPAGILAGSPRGRNSLYVAMTRSTRRLGVLHPGEPPAQLAALPARRDYC